MQGATKAAVSRLLVVGDARPLISILEKLREDAHWQADFASHWEGAAARLRNLRYAVVLAHIGLEGADELTLIRHLRSVNPDIKLILFVEQSTTDQVIAAIRSHAFSYFSYPFDVGEACHMIATAAALTDWTNGIEVLSAAPEYLTLRLRCSLDTADRLVQFMKEVPIELLPEEQQDTAQAFREMLLNAIEHGGKLNPEEWVRVSRIRTQRTLVYHIVDPGAGFSRFNIPHAAITNPDDPLMHLQARDDLGYRSGGFGMLIASHLVDEVIYNEQGNHVILIKHLD